MSYHGDILSAAERNVEKERRPNYKGKSIATGVTIGLVALGTIVLPELFSKSNSNLDEYFTKWKTVEYIEPGLAYDFEDVPGRNEDLKSRYLTEIKKRNKGRKDGKI